MGGGGAPPNCASMTPISVSEAAAPTIRVMACKADLYSLIITKQLYTCKYTAIDCTIVTLVGDRGRDRDRDLILVLWTPPPWTPS